MSSKDFSFERSTHDQSENTAPKKSLCHNAEAAQELSASSDIQVGDNAHSPLCKSCITAISNLSRVMESHRECIARFQQDISQLNTTVSNLTIAVTKLVTVMEKDQFDQNSDSSYCTPDTGTSLVSSKPNNLSLSFLAHHDKSSLQDNQNSSEEAVQDGVFSQEEEGKLALAGSSNLAVLPFASGSSSVRSSPTPMFIIDSNDFEVPCTCLCEQQDSPLLPYIHDNQIHFITMVPGTKKKSLITSKLPQGHIESYNLVDDKNKIQLISFNNCVRSVCPTMISYLDKITVFGSISADDISTVNRLQVSLYQIIKGEKFYKWEIINDSEFSTKLDLKNTICITYGNDGVVVLSVLNQVTGLYVGKLTISLFMPSKSAGKKWCQAYVFLPELSDDLCYKIQSCLVISDYVYCSFVLKGMAAYVYEINVAPLTQCSRETLEEDLPLLKKRTVIEDHNLQNCFLIVLNKRVNIITFMNVQNETVLDVWPLTDFSSTMMPKSQYHYGFHSVIKVATASISGTQGILTVIYHVKNSKKCVAKIFKLQ